MAKIMDGKVLAQKIRLELKKEVENLKKNGVKPKYMPYIQKDLQYV